MDDTALIQLDAVSFAYGTNGLVLDQLDLAIAPGDRLGLIGANGSGKTTLLHLVMGLIRPTAGILRIFGQPRQAERDFQDVRGRVGLLFQDSDDQLFCPTVVEDVAFGPLNLGKTRGEAVEVSRQTLRELGLTGYENRITYRLSLGEKRLVALATVLAMKPEALLLDEPTANLDAHAAQAVTDALNRLDTPMLIVSHDEAFLQRVTETRLILSEGCIHPRPPEALQD